MTKKASVELKKGVKTKKREKVSSAIQTKSSICFSASCISVLLHALMAYQIYQSFEWIYLHYCFKLKSSSTIKGLLNRCSMIFLKIS